MTINATAGKGTIFRRLVNSVYEDIADINSISGPSMSRETIDVTSLDSSGSYREFIGSLRDGGEVSLEMNFTRDTFDTLFADFGSDTLGDYEILLPDDENTSINFTALVTSLPLDIPLDDKITCSVTLKISGEVNLNSGSGSS